MKRNFLIGIFILVYLGFTVSKSYACPPPFEIYISDWEKFSPLGAYDGDWKESITAVVTTEGNPADSWDWDWPSGAYDTEQYDDPDEYSIGECKFNATGEYEIWATGEDEYGQFDSDYARVYVFEMDLDIDGVSDGDEEDPGGYVGVNDDDDNGNGTPDKDESGTVSGEDDLVEISLAYEPSSLSSGYIQLKRPCSNIKVWSDPDKGTLVIPDGGNSYKKWPIGSQPSTLYVEGCSPGDAELWLQYTDNGYSYPGGLDNHDPVKFTVVGINKIEIDAGPGYGWRNVSDQTITVLKGTKYNFKAFLEPSGESWPASKPVWKLNGSVIGSGTETKEVTFDSEGTFTLRAMYADDGNTGGKAVTINVVQPTVYQVGFGSDHTLYETPSANDGWADSTTAFTDPVYDSDASINDPICVTKNTNSVSLTNVKLKVTEALSYTTTIRVDASGTEEWNESSNVTFSGTTSAVTSLSITGNIINEVKKYSGNFQNQWKYKVPSGTDVWYTINTTSHTVYVTWGTPAGSSVTEKRINWLCQKCNSNTTPTQCSDDIFTALDTTSPDPPDFVLGGGNPSNKWHMMDPNGPSGNCLGLAMLMQDMYELIGCEGGEIGYIYATTDSSCYGTSSSLNETRTCPGGTHGLEVLYFYASDDYNKWEAVFSVNGFYYAVKETKDSIALHIIEDIIDSDPAHHQAWRYWDDGWNSCSDPGPYPVPVGP